MTHLKVMALERQLGEILAAVRKLDQRVESLGSRVGKDLAESKQTVLEIFNELPCRGRRRRKCPA